MGPSPSTALAVELRGARQRGARSPARMLARGRTTFLAVFALVAFGAIPFAFLAGRGGVFTGATGIFPGDQLQYLAWIRDIGAHGLARNMFDLAPSSHVFVDPVFALSAALVRLGVSPAWAYEAWLPVAAAALLAGYSAYVRRLLSGKGERFAATSLALFAVTPAAPLLAWFVGLPAGQRNQLALAVADSTPALQLWGYFPIALALAFLCASLLAVERAVDRARHSGRSWRAEAAIAATAGATASWIHPWQGLTLIVMLVALAAIERSRRVVVVCALTAIAACLPLAYYYVLPHVDAAWSAARAQNNLTFDGWVAAAVLLPLALPALAAARGRAVGVQERLLLLWPLAAGMVFWLDPPYSIHALESASLPLAILGVRGCRRLRVRGAIAAGLVVLATVPGLVFAADLLRQAVSKRPEAYVLRTDNARALRVAASSPIRGGLLAPAPIASVVPGYTGRSTWLGHPTWTPALGLREHEASRLFGGRMRPEVARRFVHSVGARLAVAPCGSSPRLERLLGPGMLVQSTPVGCARVLTLRR